MFKMFLLLLLVPFHSFALTEAEWGGKLWGNHLRKNSDLEKEYTQENAGTFLFAKTKPTENTSIKTELIGYYVKTPFLEVPGKDLGEGEFFSEINELSVAYSQESWNMKAGQMTTSWGKSDGLNPTDFLSGRRNTLLVTDDQLTRRGHTSAMVEWLPEGGSAPWSFQQWIIPLHSRTDVLLNKKLTQDLVELESNVRSGRVELASRINYSGQGWEFDYTYFNGVNKTPVYTESARQLFPFTLKIKPNYVHQEAHGINLAKDFEDFVLRFEGAYTKRDEVLENADYIKDPSRIDAVAGFEKSFFESHRFNVQGVFHHYPNYERNDSLDPITNQIKILNRFTLAQHLETRAGYLLIYYFEPSSYNQLKIKCSWLNYFHNESASLFTPQIEYLVTDNLQLQAYALIFNGSKNSPFGVLEQLSSAGIGANYQF